MSSDNQVTLPEPKPFYHGRYKPSGRIILKSNDGQLFSIPRSLLVKNSVVFRDMFKLPRPGFNDITQPPKVSTPTIIQLDSPTPPAKKARFHYPLRHPANRARAARRRAESGESGAQDGDRALIELDSSRNANPAAAVLPSPNLISGIDMWGAAEVLASGSGQGNSHTAIAGSTDLNGVPGGDGATLDESKGKEDGEKAKEKKDEDGDEDMGEDEDDGWGAPEMKKGDTCQEADPDTPEESKEEKKQEKTARAPQPDPIEIDIDWSTLAFFLDLLTLAQFSNKLISPSALDLDLGQIKLVLPLVKKFDCRKAETMLRARLETLAKSDPWKVLNMASDQEDLEAGRMAIGLMHPIIHLRGLWAQLDQLRPSWQLAFLKTVAPITAHHSDFDAEQEVLGLQFQNDLTQAAKSFRPTDF